MVHGRTLFLCCPCQLAIDVGYKMLVSTECSRQSHLPAHFYNIIFNIITKDDGGPATISQSPNHDRPAELRCRGTISVEQSSCCSTETRDSSAHFKETTEGLSVPHLMCWQTEGTFTTTRRCCDIFVILAPGSQDKMWKSGNKFSTKRFLHQCVQQGV